MIATTVSIETKLKEMTALTKMEKATLIKVNAYCHAKTGVAMIGAFVNSPEHTVEERIKLMDEVIEHLKNGTLTAEVAKGEREIEPVNEEKEPAPVNRVTAQPKPVFVQPEPEKPVTGGANEEAVALITRAMQMMRGQPVDAKVSPEDVKKIVVQWADENLHECIKKANGNGAFPTERVAKAVQDALANHAQRIEIVTPKGEVKVVEGLMHCQTTQLHAWCVTANVPTWAWGSAGAGKTHLARQIAKLGLNGEELPCYVMSVDPTLTVAKLVGFRNIVNGDFIEGWLYKPFKEGGLIAFDEIDTGDPAIIACLNALIANEEYLFPNGETVKRHANFRILALANTKGTGATAGYTARNRLDAATLDRFAVIELKYDEKLELSIATGENHQSDLWKPGKPVSHDVIKAYVKWVQSVRQHAGTSVLISPRAAINGAKALRCGINIGEAVDALVFKLVTADTEQRLLSAAGQYPQSN